MPHISTIPLDKLLSPQQADRWELERHSYKMELLREIEARNLGVSEAISPGTKHNFRRIFSSKRED